MDILVLSLAILLASGVAALLACRFHRLATWIGAGGAGVGCAIGLIPALQVLLRNVSLSLVIPWNVPFGEFNVGLDALSALFLVPILGLSALAALYGSQYLAAWRGRKWTGATWFYFNLLVAGMALVVIARNSILFLAAWEVMSLASFFLVAFEDEKEAVQKAGWIYLIATHVGFAFLMTLFILMGQQAGSMNITAAGFPALPHGIAAALFVLAVIGFGTKAGFVPLHVWLPEAHPAAPSHVSALMSGAMIKTGIYGLLRVLTVLGPPMPWWGMTLIVIGLTSGILGVLFALAQQDLKRLLAYSSVENIGIIALGLGLGLLGISYHEPFVAVAGFAGALLHVVNHAAFKGLLFLGAGAVAHETGTREIDRLGGLLKRMPWTGTTFLVGATAISGLPPLNGFIGEFLIFLGAFKGVLSAENGMVIPALGTVLGLVLIGGLAAACFAKAFGIVFLGEPRTEHVSKAHDVGWAMRIPMLVLAVACVVIGLAAPAVCRVVIRIVGDTTGMETAALAGSESNLITMLTYVIRASILLIAVTAFLVVLRRFLLAGRRIAETGTWDCGFVRPSVRMQYTASSFVQPLTNLFRLTLRTRERVSSPQGLFPKTASLATETPDIFHRDLFRPAFTFLRLKLDALRWLQQGRVHLYVLYIAITILILLIWSLGS